MNKRKRKPRYDTTAKVAARMKNRHPEAVRDWLDESGRCFDHPGNSLPCPRH